MAARFLLAIALVASIRPLVGGADASACSCALTNTQDRVAMAGFVVLGTVVQIDQIEDNEPGAFTQQYDVSVAVNEYLKGSGPNQVVVRVSSLSSSGCSPFDPDSAQQRFLLFLSHHRGNLRTSTCAGSGQVGDSDQSQQYFEELRQIVSNSANDPLPVWATAASFGAAILLGAGLLLGVRRLGSS